MAVTLSDSTVFSSGLSSGMGVLVGRVTCSDNYATGGEPIDISNYFQAASNVTITVGGMSNYYHIVHTLGGNAAASNFVVCISNSEASNTTFTEIDAASDLSTLSFDIFAIGKLR